MDILEKMLSYGYFPKELPPRFTSLSFSLAMTNIFSTVPASFNDGKFITKSITHNVARKGSLRRKLGIPNPINFYRISKVIHENWMEIETIINSSHLSMTTPVHSAEVSGRAFSSKKSLNELPDLHANIRSQFKFILKTDVSRFYHSIYTHSIAWACHTKEIAKSNHRNTLYGNLLDKVCRDAQDQQTIGLPIGPDSSLVIAELILSNIDRQLQLRGIKNGFRYIDDYYLGFNSLSEAEGAIAVLQEQLTQYELALNPLKTEIISLPLSFEDLLISEIRTFVLRNDLDAQRSDIIFYFNKVFTAAKNTPEESIIKYAVARLFPVDIHEKNYKLFENYLLQCVMSDASAIKYVANHLLKYKYLGYGQDLIKLKSVLRTIMLNESVHVHGNEISYCLYVCLLFRFELEVDVVTTLSTIRDPFVAILLCDCYDNGLVPFNVDFSFYESLMITEELKGDMWVFVYEMLYREWFSPAQMINPIIDLEQFKFMKNNSVSFYQNDEIDEVYKPSQADTDYASLNSIL